MMKYYLLGLSAGIAMLLYAATPVCAETGCGFAPIKPLPPLGCQDIVARCQCDRDADGALQCRWVWDCITD
jgi:hypothetical protein